MRYCPACKKTFIPDSARYCYSCQALAARADAAGVTHNEHTTLREAVVKLLDIADPGGSGSILVRVEELAERLVGLTSERQQVEAFAALSAEERMAQTEAMGNVDCPICGESHGPDIAKDCPDARAIMASPKFAEPPRGTVVVTVKAFVESVEVDYESGWVKINTGTIP